MQDTQKSSIKPKSAARNLVQQRQKQQRGNVPNIPVLTSAPPPKYRKNSTEHEMQDIQVPQRGQSMSLHESYQDNQYYSQEEEEDQYQEDDAPYSSEAESPWDPTLVDNTNYNASYIPVPTKDQYLSPNRSQSGKGVSFGGVMPDNKSPLFSSRESSLPSPANTPKKQMDAARNVSPSDRNTANQPNIDRNIANQPNILLQQQQEQQRRLLEDIEALKQQKQQMIIIQQQQEQQMKLQQDIQMLQQQKQQLMNSSADLGSPSSRRPSLPIENASSPKTSQQRRPSLPTSEHVRSRHSPLENNMAMAPNIPITAMAPPQQQTRSSSYALSEKKLADAGMKRAFQQRPQVEGGGGVYANEYAVPQKKPLATVSSQTEKSIITTSCQTDADYRLVEKTQEIEMLRAQVASLKTQVENVTHENQVQANLLTEQKKGFDKLSAQAYKKIKNLMNEKQVMSIEIMSLKSQVGRICSLFD